MFAYGGICAAKVLHSRLLKSILSAPVSFFDVTPVCIMYACGLANQRNGKYAVAASFTLPGATKFRGTFIWITSNNEAPRHKKRAGNIELKDEVDDRGSANLES